MKHNFLNNRYSILFSFILMFVLCSASLRTILLIMSASSAALTFPDIFRIYIRGFIFDTGVALFFSALYSIWLLLLPQRWNNSKINRMLTYAGLFLLLVIVMFSFFAEVTFWLEFESRFNFIAVDYLIYTYEVFNNIKESYPLPVLISGILLPVVLIFWFSHKRGILIRSFVSHTPFRMRVFITGTIILLTVFYLFAIKNSWAEQGTNRYANELSKAGIWSFFAAYRNNEISYNDFYKRIDENEASLLLRNALDEKSVTFTKAMPSIRRIITNDSFRYKPNVIMITIESFSADFMRHYGNTQNLTPFLDSLADNSIVFNNMYATGTRTIRGMEALTLAIPPTPGSSIVRRPNNNNLFTVGSVFKSFGYERTFLYGGDGYFDNMNQYFGSNGYNISDRGRNITIGDEYKTKRHIIPDSLVRFENAWGICDEDLYDEVIRNADVKYSAGKPFYDFVMTTSNHRPFTYPKGKVDLPAGTREGAVKYTDYAISRLFKMIRNKPWYDNTVVILVADHCASSAGKNEIDISKYHIPCMIVNLKTPAKMSIDKMCSQIDIYPTLFSLLGWSYESNFFGKDATAADFIPRAVLGTYQKLAYLKNDSLVILGPQQTIETYIYQKSTNKQMPAPLRAYLINEAVAYYQSAYNLYKNKGLKE